MGKPPPRRPNHPPAVGRHLRLDDLLDWRDRTWRKTTTFVRRHDIAVYGSLFAACVIAGALLIGESDPDIRKIASTHPPVEVTAPPVEQPHAPGGVCERKELP